MVRCQLEQSHPGFDLVVRLPLAAGESSLHLLADSDIFRSTIGVWGTFSVDGGDRMAVLVEGISVLIKALPVIDRYADGWRTFGANSLNFTPCAGNTSTECVTPDAWEYDRSLFVRAGFITTCAR